MVSHGLKILQAESKEFDLTARLHICAVCSVLAGRSCPKVHFNTLKLISVHQLFLSNEEIQFVEKFGNNPNSI